MSESFHALPAPEPVPLSPQPQTPRPSWVRRFIVDYNPFFLLSAMSMLAGSLALTNSMSWSPVRLERILALTFTINLYELLLVALGLFLIVKRNVRRDGSILLILEAFFLVDVAFLNSELFTISPWVGLAANVAVFLLVLVKLAANFIVLRIPMNSPLIAVIGIELLALFALPGLLKLEATLSGGRLTPLTMYVAWWVIFGIGVLTIGALRSYAAQGKLTWFAPLVSLLSCVSLIAHAGTGQWVYDTHYWGANLAPMLALAAFLLLPSLYTRPAGFFFAIAAVFAALSHNHTLNLYVFGHSIRPVDLTAFAIYLIVGWTLLRGIFFWLLAVGAIAGLASVFGPSVVTVRGWTQVVLERVVSFLDLVRPKTQTHWGIVGVAMSFVFLVIGAVISLRRSPGAEQPQS